MASINLWLDLESRSRVDLKLHGVDRYAKDPSTEITLAAWAINEALPDLWRPWETEGQLPEQLGFILREAAEIPIFAFNSQFEQTMLREVLKIDIPTRRFVDVAVNCRYASIAGPLGFCGKVLGIDEDKAKLATGKKLIRLFCVPRKKDGLFNDWRSHPEKWAEFEKYCPNDLIAEREIYKKLKAFSLPPQERKIWVLDQAINLRGLPIDMTFVANASKIVEQERTELTAEFKELTGLKNPNSVSQLLGWLKNEAYAYGSLGAPWVKRGLLDEDVTPAGLRGLQLRQLLAKSSTAKLEALANLVGLDGFLRNQYVYGGAARTLRWSGRGFQPQNLPRPTIKKIPEAILAILSGDREAVRQFGPPLEVVASCLRGALMAPKGKKFVICDLSSIEVVVLAWLAECPSLLQVFEEGRDPYIEFAAEFYRIAHSEVTKEQRQICKPPVLGCGYGLGGGEMGFDKNHDEIRTGLWGYAQNMGVDMLQSTAVDAVILYRKLYPEVPAAWRRWENAVLAALEHPGEKYVCNGMVFGALKKLLWIQLPSSRRLHYIRPEIHEDEKGRKKLSYEGQLLGGGWGRVTTWGGKLTENLVQAISRDVMAHGMLKAAEAGFSIIGTSHDEIICLEDVDSPFDAILLRECMTERPWWAKDLPLNAAGFEAERYRKD